MTGWYGDGALEPPPDTSDSYRTWVDLDDLLNETDEGYDWLIPGLLEVGDRVILTGLEGGGKSTLLRQFAVQAGSGIHPFGGDHFAPLSVLTIDLENSRRQTRRKVSPIREAAGDRYDEDSPGVAWQFRSDGLDLTDTAQLAWLTTVVSHYAPQLLIVGPLYKLMNGDPKSEETAAAVARGLDAARSIGEGCAVIIEAHTPYADGSRSKRPTRPYGASLWSRWPEFGIHLAPDGAVEHWRGPRDEREWPSRLRRGEPWPWMPADPEGPEEWDGPTSCMAAVKELLTANPNTPYSGAALARSMRTLGHGFRERTVRDAAERLAIDGVITVRSGARGARIYSTQLDTELIDDTF